MKNKKWERGLQILGKKSFLSAALSKASLTLNNKNICIIHPVSYTKCTFNKSLIKLVEMYSLNTFYLPISCILLLQCSLGYSLNNERYIPYCTIHLTRDFMLAMNDWQLFHFWITTTVIFFCIVSVNTVVNSSVNVLPVWDWQV